MSKEIWMQLKNVFNTILFMVCVSTVLIPIYYYISTGNDYILDKSGKLE